MPKKRLEENTRQLYASIREDIYLAAKSRATALRMPLREFIEYALELALTEEPPEATRALPRTAVRRTIWDDDFLKQQTEQPVGSEVELSREEAERVVRASFGSAGQRKDSSGG